MMDGNFEINKMGYYTVQNVAENEFLNEKLDNQNYGIWYTVKFQGAAETYLWMAKTKPEEAKHYFGHIEPTKSGKAFRFKKDREPDSAPAQLTAAPSPGKYNTRDDNTQENIARSVALKAAVDIIAAGKGVHGETIFDLAEKFLAWLQGGDKPVETVENPPARPWENVGKPKVEEDDHAFIQKGIEASFDEPPPDYPM